MKKIAIVNGPNLNLLGLREPHIYGNTGFDAYFLLLQQKYNKIELNYFQSNIEGEIVNFLHACLKNKIDAIVINPAGYSHTSIAIADAIAAINIPAIEVHISNVHAREKYRHTLITASKCIGVISGLGLIGYDFAIEKHASN